MRECCRGPDPRRVQGHILLLGGLHARTDSFTKPSLVGGRRRNGFIPVRSALGRLFLSFHVAETLNLLSASCPCLSTRGSGGAARQAHPCPVSCPSRSCMDVICVSLVGDQGPGSARAQPAQGCAQPARAQCCPGIHHGAGPETCCWFLISNPALGGECSLLTTTVCLFFTLGCVW